MLDKCFTRSQQRNTMYRLLIAALLATAVAGDDDSLPPRATKDYPLFPEVRIVGGWNTTIEDYPWQVSLQVLGFHFCGGSIISEKIILTAGHCSTYPTGWISARVGSSELVHGGAVHRVGEVVRHEKYKVNDFGVPEYDIAILKLKTSIVFGKASQPIPLFNKGEDAQEGVTSTISGWGATKEGGGVFSYLMAVDVPVVSKAYCSKAYEPTHGVLPEGQICAAFPEGGKDTCQGDSGGPMVIDGRQAGVVSWGNGCARPNFPGVYTEIAYFRDWIKTHAGV